MANFEGKTASNGAKIKKDRLKELITYISEFSSDNEDGDMIQMEKEEDGYKIYIYGYAFFAAYKMTVVHDPDNLQSDYSEPDFDNEVTETFLLGLAPFLEEPLIVQSIGNEKCRYPLAAWEYKISPDGNLEGRGFSL